MKLKIAVIGLILVAACLSGCINKDQVTTNTYRCTIDEGILYLSSNAEYEMVADKIYGDGHHGVYVTRDDAVLLKTEIMGIIRKYTIDGRDLIDPDGDRWVRD